MEKEEEQVRDEFPMDAMGYRIVCEIGISEHSMVYKAICQSMNSAIVAVKVVDMDKLLDRDNVDKNIINSLSHIDHPNILTPHCSFMVHRQLWIVMPFIHAGSLENVVAARFPNGLPEQFLAILLHQLLSALVCLHQLGHVHKNIKPTNIFIDSKGTVKLSDVNIFKSIKAVRGSDDSYSVPYWVAPEVGKSNDDNNDDEHSFKSDVWSIGVVALELAYGCAPISDSRARRSQLVKILRRFPYSLNVEKVLSNNNNDIMYSKLFSDLFKDFVSCCLVKDPCQRPSTMNLLTHSLVKSKGDGSNSSNILFKNIPKDTMGIEYSFQQCKDRLASLMKNGDDQTGKFQMIISCWDFNSLAFKLKPDEKIIPLKEEGKLDGTASGGRVEKISCHDRILSPLQESFDKLIDVAGKFLKQEKERGIQLDSVVNRELKRLNVELMASLQLESELRMELRKLKK